MSSVIAIIKGLESKSSLSMEDSYFDSRYIHAQELINQGYYVIKTSYGYQIKKHKTEWKRRVR